LKSLPEPLLQELRRISGFDEASFIHAHQQPAVVSVRLNPYKDIGLFAASDKVPWCSSGIYLPERPVFTLDPSYNAGAYYVQEASSMFLASMLDSILPEKRNLRVLDLCAAPGGKSTLIASLLDKDSLLVSNEVIRSRASILDENMTRWGYMNSWVTANDPRDFARIPGYFDVIVVDAPCSGSGLFRKDSRVLSDWSRDNVTMCAGRQQRILADVWPALKEDGVLIYATCSYSTQENEDVLDWLASEFEVSGIQAGIKSEWGISAVVSPLREMPAYRFFPGKVSGEGFFIAAVRKKEAPDAMRPQRYKTAHDKKIQSQAGYLLKDPEALFIQTDKENYSAIRPGHEVDWQTLREAVHFRKVGLRLGVPVAKEWLPAHDVALSIEASESLDAVDVDKEKALRFLKREDLGIPSIPKGWQMIRYKGLGLGWIKSLGNRANNYLPKHWRIRMEISDTDW
jgi:16S rRNA C967 or C1407 C5-methylase (RsmB/RsmF family)/NOL1/NOP2/fmu family ribosome biogenesis protein